MWKWLKPWPNKVASIHKFSTCICLQLHLGRPCVHLRWLAMTCAHFGQDQICIQVDANFSPFGHPTQVHASWVTYINLLLANEIQGIFALKWVFCDLHVLVRKCASPFGHATQVQLVATYNYLWFSLARALNSVLSFVTDSIGLHRVENVSHTDTAASLHVYIPAFDMCQSFDQRTGYKRKCQVTFWSKFGSRTPYVSITHSLYLSSECLLSNCYFNKDV